MNTCMILSTLLVIIILLRVIFIMTEIGYYVNNNNEFKPINLKNVQANILAYEKFEKIYKDVFIITSTGRNEYQFNLCYKNPIVTTQIKKMLEEAFPVSTLEEIGNVRNCTTYKMNW